MGLPVFVENSRVPVVLSKISPIDIGAISLGLFVFSRGEISEVTRQHETIHYRQWLELGFILFPILYGWFWLWNRLKGQSGEPAYFNIPFEREAYDHQTTEGYLDDRKLWAWLKYR